MAHLTSVHRAHNVSLCNLRRLIDSTISQATRPVTDKEGETRRSSANLRFEDRKNAGTLPRFVTTTQTRIINPRNMVPCSLYLPVITIFLCPIYLPRPSSILSETHLLPLMPRSPMALSRVTTWKVHLRSAIRVPTREA